MIGAHIRIHNRRYQRRCGVSKVASPLARQAPSPPTSASASAGVDKQSIHQTSSHNAGVASNLPSLRSQTASSQARVHAVLEIHRPPPGRTSVGHRFVPTVYLFAPGSHLIRSSVASSSDSEHETAAADRNGVGSGWWHVINAPLVIHTLFRGTASGSAQPRPA